MIDRPSITYLEKILVADDASKSRQHPQETSNRPSRSNIGCLLAGTLILTSSGKIPVENLEVGMRIMTKDSGFVQLIGLGSFSPSTKEVSKNPALQLIVFPKDSIGNNSELRMTASQNVLIEHPTAELFFGDNETLASAKDFVGYNGIHAVHMNAPTALFHLLFEEHQIINANGTWTESLFFANLGIRVLHSTETWDFIKDIQLKCVRHSQTARQILNQQETTLLLNEAIINEHEEFTPKVNVYTSSKMKSTVLDDGIPAFEKMSG